MPSILLSIMVEDMETNPWHIVAMMKLFMLKCNVWPQMSQTNHLWASTMHKREYLNYVPSILASHVKCEQFLIQFINQLHHAIWTQIAIQAQILDQYPSTRRVYIWHICSYFHFIKLGDSPRPPHTRDWEPVTIILQALSLVEKAEPVQVRFTLRLRHQRSMWMQDGCRVYMNSYMASNGSCFLITWTILITTTWM